MNVDSGKIMEVLTELANKLGVAVEYLWSVIVKQQVATGVSNIIISIFYVASIILIIKYAPKAIKHFSERKKMLEDERINKGKGGYLGCSSISSSDEDFANAMSMLITVFSFIVVMCLILMTIACVNSGIKMIINPDYYAFKDIMRLLGR